MVENYIPKLWTVSKICNVISTSVLINMFCTIKSNKMPKRTVKNRIHKIFRLEPIYSSTIKRARGEKTVSKKRKKKKKLHKKNLEGLYHLLMK